MPFNSHENHFLYINSKKKQPTVFDVECMCPFIRLMHITLAYNIKYALTDCFINLLSEKKPSIF